MNSQRVLWILVAFAATPALDLSVAWAYHNADFATPVSRGGGNGIYFTGSPRYKRWGCTTCHIRAEELIGIEISSNPSELIDRKQWTPGRVYELTVTMTGAHRGDPTMTNGYDTSWLHKFSY